MASLNFVLQELSDQVEEAHRQCQTEKQARIEVEQSLRERIKELEQRLSAAARDADALRFERHSQHDSVPANKLLVTEQEQVGDCCSAVSCIT